MLDSVGGRNRQFSKAGAAAAMLAVLALAGCPSARRAAPPPPAVPGAPATDIAPPAAGATRYRVDSGASLVVMLAYRGGTLAALGHNHVIASRALQGVVDVREPLTASTFELRLPLASLTVDEPALRSRHGPDFAGPVPDSAREGTRHNMLGEGLLDAADFPQLSVRSLSLSGGPHNFAARIEVNLRGQSHAVDVPVQVDRPDADRLHVAARFPVAQSALGLAPFSVMLGALQVEDLIGVEVDISARRVP